MEKEKNIINMVRQNLKVNIQMEKEMEKEKNIIIMKLKFEGEYLNGERKGKEYYYNGKLKFEEEN